MSFWSKYVAYIQDNPNHYWFKRKIWGWGWTPSTWQGWLVLVAFIALMLLNFLRLDANSHSASDTLRPFFIQTAILVGLLIIICYKKGEPPKWQWGIPNDDADSEYPDESIK